jgi:hypothetical protein
VHVDHQQAGVVRPEIQKRQIAGLHTTPAGRQVVQINVLATHCWKVANVQILVVHRFPTNQNAKKWQRALAFIEIGMGKSDQKFFYQLGMRLSVFRMS